VIIWRAASASTEPTSPAFDTATAISGVDTPAIGAWMMGDSIPSFRMKGSTALLLLKWRYHIPVRIEEECRQFLDASVGSTDARNRVPRRLGVVGPTRAK
jgi:hypothetical protein